MSISVHYRTHRTKINKYIIICIGGRGTVITASGDGGPERPPVCRAARGTRGRRI